MSAPALSERGGDSLVASGGERQGRIKDVPRFQIGTVNELCDTYCSSETRDYMNSSGIGGLWVQFLSGWVLRYLWEVEVQMSRVELEVQIWTEDLGVAINLFSALVVIPSRYSLRQLFITQLRSVFVICFSLLLLSITRATFTFQSPLFSR